jgi:hypothetical protein
MFCFMSVSPELAGSYPNPLRELHPAEQCANQALYQPHELASLIFDSFWFSQGDAYIQPEITRYIIARERSRITQAVLDTAFPIAAKRTATFIRRPDIHTVDLTGKNGTKPENHESQMSQRYDDWLNALQDPDLTDSYSSIQILTGGVVARDYKYLTMERGRPRTPNGPAQDNEFTRPYLSHFVYYGLTGHTTHRQIYDEMFSDIVDASLYKWSDYVRSQDKRSKTGESYVGVFGNLVQEVAEIHFQHYPQDHDQLPLNWHKQLEIIPQPFVV